LADFTNSAMLFLNMHLHGGKPLPAAKGTNHQLARGPQHFSNSLVFQDKNKLKFFMLFWTKNLVNPQLLWLRNC